MRVYRLAIMTLLAGVTVILLGTAVYAMQTPSAPITHNELYKQTQRDTPLRLSARGADYLAIVADEAGFMQALAPLLAYREDEGLQVTAVSLAQIAAEFGDGEASPQTIRDFLAYTVENWQPAPQFVLLVGDATNDGQPGGSGQNLLPTYLLETDDGSAAASDSWYTSFDAPTSMSIGRFPVQTPEQLTAVVNKTIAYETAVAKSPQATWLQRALLIAADEASFDTATEHLEANLDDSGYQIHDLHMSQDADIYAHIVTVLNRGVGLLNYTGHGSKTSIADGMAFTADDARLLQNENRLPIFTAFSCQNGTFTDPNQASLAEQLLLTENGGIVAAIGTAAHMETQHSLSLTNTFYSYLLHGSATTLGEVLANTKTAVTNDADGETAVHTYNLLGDPALHIHHPAQGQLASPQPAANPAVFVTDQ